MQPASFRTGRWTSLLGIALVLGTFPGASSARTVLDLSGSWQYQKAGQLNYPPPNNWQSITVPGYLSGNPYEHAWYRRTFTLPGSRAESRIKLRFGGVKFDSRVWVNGVFVGGYLNGYEPFELDITQAVQVGRENELVVGLTDWTATFARPVDFNNLAPYENLRDHAKDTLLAPIGGRYDLYGIWQPVQIVSVPAVSIADVFVMPSVRQNRLTARVTLRNDAPSAQTVLLKNRVLDANTPTISLADRTITVNAGSTSQLDVTVTWSNPHLWSHLDPHLYHLESTVDNGGIQDTVDTRFGFREFWTEGDKCYLNGTRTNLLATSTWPPGSLLSRSEIQKVLTDVKAGNNVAMRLHTQPWDEQWYDVADEVGLMLVEEGALWCDSYSYRLEDPVFWTNYAQHLTAAVRRDHNHPSIVLWSLENELLHCGGAKAYSGTEQKLAEMGRLVKTLDPTRPITYEADLDPNGAADVIGVHYPHEFPDYALWPNAAFWMDQPISRDWVAGGQWKWLRDKPLYIGEFLWVPSTSAQVFTILYGDDTYFDPSQYRNLAKAWTWQMQIEAYRSYGVNGICPWTMFEDPAVPSGVFDLNPDHNYLYQAQKAAYHPNAVFVQPYNTRFFAGDTAQLSLGIYNDTMAAGSFALKWRSGEGEPWMTRTFNMDPADRRVEPITFDVPATVGPFTVQIELDNGIAPVFSKTLAYTAHPHRALAVPQDTKLGVYDPKGDTAAILARYGVGFVRVTDLRTAAYDRLNLLIVGRDALAEDSEFEVGPEMLAAKWESFAQRGGWVFVMEQSVYPRWMPLALSLEDVPANLAFPDPRHPITRNLSVEDLRWWAGDHRVADKAIRAPSRGNCRVPVRIGSQQGLEYAGLLEVAIGNGGLICSQLLLNKRFDAEPMAGILWQRLLDYCTSSSGHLSPKTAGLVAETDAAAATRLSQLGLLSQPLLGKLANCDPQAQPVLVIAGGDAVWNEASRSLTSLVAYVEQGGRLMLHEPSEAFLGNAQSELFPELDWADAILGLVLRRDSNDASVVLANHDLYWVDQAGSWDRPEVMSTHVAHRIYRKHFNLTSYSTLQVEDMPIHTTGSAISGGWALYTNGYVGQNITVSKSGAYLVNVKARGTPVAGVYPLMSLRVDGRSQDFVYVDNEDWRFYTMSVDLATGTHELAISFDNDAYQPPADRNLFLAEVQYGLDTDTGGVTLLTKPGAIAQVRRGKGLVLLDEIAWDVEEQNRVKADRVAGTLLTGLGAALDVHPSLRIEAEEMKNVDVAAYSSSNGIVYINSNGRIEAPVRFTSSGNYTFEVLASGTPAANVAPVLELRIDGVARKAISIDSRSFNRYDATVSVTAGLHTVALAFTNDYYAPPEDRNVAVDRLTISPEP
jgi:hypothetical protein